MGLPNYGYCAAYCPGRILNCEYYERTGLLAVCKHYKLVQSVVDEPRRDLSRAKLEEIVEAARMVFGE